jgi:two-component system, response regulator PdtaR
MGGMRVVVSTGSAGIRKKISTVLAAADILVIGEADSGPGALRLIQQLQPDVAIIDIDTAPGMSAAKMLEEDGQIGLVLMGTHPRRNHNGPHVSGQILKPVNDTALLTAVEFAAAGQMRLRKMADELAKAKDTLETRKLVEKAKGILMETLGLAETEAYRRIQQQSMNKRVSLKRIAEAIITAHEFR